jgi:hypothetical protein
MNADYESVSMENLVLSEAENSTALFFMNIDIGVSVLCRR